MKRSSRRLMLRIECREPGCGRERTVALPARYREQFAKLDAQEPQHQLRMIERLVSDGCEAILRCGVRGHSDATWEIVETAGARRRRQG